MDVKSQEALKEVFDMLKERAIKEGFDLGELQTRFDEIAFKAMNLEPQITEPVVPKEEFKADNAFSPSNQALNKYLKELNNEYMKCLSIISKTKEVIDIIHKLMISVDIKLPLPSMTMFDQCMSIYWENKDTIINIEIRDRVSISKLINKEAVDKKIFNTVNMIELEDLLAFGLHELDK